MAMDPVTQTLAQQSSGSAEGQGFGQFFVQGAQLAQGRRQLNLAQQRIDIERSQEQRLSEAQKMLLPLQADALRNTNANAGIELKSNSLKLDAMTQANAAMPAMYDLMLRFQANPDGYNNELLRQEFRSLLEKFPSAGVSTVGQQLWQALEAQPMFDARLKRIEEAKRRLGDDLRSFNPETGAATFQDTLGGVRATANIKDVEKLASLRADIAALPEGSPERIEKETQLDDMTTAFKGQQQLRARGLDLKAEAQTASKALAERRLRLAESLPPIQQAALKAELAIVEDSIKLMNDDAAKAERVAEIIAKYEQLSKITTAPQVGNVTPTGTPRLRWDPATRRLIPATNAPAMNTPPPARGLSPTVDALDPVTVP